MNKFMFVCAAVGAVALSGCSCTRIDPGNVGIKVELTGDNKGVAPTPLSPGYYFVGPTSEMYEFPTFEQNHVWDKEETFSFQTREGLSVQADIGINYHISSDNVPSVFQKYRRGMDEITHVFMRNAVRDAMNTVASELSVEYVYGEGKEKFMEASLAKVQAEMQPIGITVSKIFVVGTFKLPEAVVHQLNSKIAATQQAQRVENELRQAEAEARKTVAQAEGASKAAIAAAEGEAKSIYLRAEAQAKANTLLSNSLTHTLVEYERVKKWNGQLPQFTTGAGGGVLLNMPVTAAERK